MSSSEHHNIVIEFDVPVEMRDGVVLRADVYRPEADGEFPVIVHRVGYGKRMVFEGLLDYQELVRAGYVVVSQDTRGRFGSEGEWLPWKFEREDGYDTVEWAAQLPFSTGKVGMYGPSFQGSTQWSAAIAGAPHLATIVPTTTWIDPDDGLLFRGGAIEHGLNVVWTLRQALTQQARSGLSPEQLVERMTVNLTDLDAIASDAYWQLPSGAPAAILRAGQPDLGVARALADEQTKAESRVAGRYDEVKVPTLSIGGWYDVFLQGSLDGYVGMRAAGQTARLVVGPWDHVSAVNAWAGGQVGEVYFGLGSVMPGGRTLTDLHRTWYDHWLKGEPATQEHESGVLLFVMGANQWRHEVDWPLERARETALFLGGAGTLSWGEVNDAAPSTFTYDPADPVPTRGGHLVMSAEYPSGPMNQRDVEEREDVLVFSTPPLDTDMEITGRISATIFAATDGPSTDWVVRLCEVDLHGVSRNIADGITRVTTEPGKVEEVEVDLWSTSILVRAGHALRVHVTSSCFPRWDRNLNTGEATGSGEDMRVARQTLFHDPKHPSRIVLPLVPVPTAVSE